MGGLAGVFPSVPLGLNVPGVFEEVPLSPRAVSSPYTLASYLC